VAVNLAGSSSGNLLIVPVNAVTSPVKVAENAA